MAHSEIIRVDYQQEGVILVTKKFIGDHEDRG
jgi:hypothetical protein